MTGPLQQRHLDRLTAPRTHPVGPWLAAAVAATGLDPVEVLAAAMSRLPSHEVLAGIGVYGGEKGDVDHMRVAHLTLPSRLQVLAADALVVGLRGSGAGIDGSGAPSILTGTDWLLHLHPTRDLRAVEVEVPEYGTSDGELENERVFVAVMKALPELLATGVALRGVVLRPGADPGTLFLRGSVGAEPLRTLSPMGGEVLLDPAVEAVLAPALDGGVPGVPTGHGSRRLTPPEARVVAAAADQLAHQPEGRHHAPALGRLIAGCRSLGACAAAAEVPAPISSRSATVPLRVVSRPVGSPAVALRAAAARLPVWMAYHQLRGRWMKKVDVHCFTGVIQDENRAPRLDFGESLSGDPFGFPMRETFHEFWGVGIKQRAGAELVVNSIGYGAERLEWSGVLLQLLQVWLAERGGGELLMADRSMPWTGSVIR